MKKKYLVSALLSLPAMAWGMATIRNVDGITGFYEGGFFQIAVSVACLLAEAVLVVIFYRSSKSAAVSVTEISSGSTRIVSLLSAAALLAFLVSGDQGKTFPSRFAEIINILFYVFLVLAAVSLAVFGMIGRKTGEKTFFIVLTVLIVYVIFRLMEGFFSGMVNRNNVVLMAELFSCVASALALTGLQKRLYEGNETGNGEAAAKALASLYLNVSFRFPCVILYINSKNMQNVLLCLADTLISAFVFLLAGSCLDGAEKDE